MLTNDEVAKVFNTMRGLWKHATFSIQQEKYLKAALRRAASENVATDALGRIYADGVIYPYPKHIVDALAVEHLRLEPQLEPDLDYPGPYIEFRDWYALQDEAMQERVRRVFPSLKIEPPGTTARAIHGGG